MDAENTFSAVAEAEGWDSDTQVGVLLDYIQRQQSPEAFADFLAEQRQYMQVDDDTSAADAESEERGALYQRYGDERLR